jgi:hypothetical protein
METNPYFCPNCRSNRTKFSLITSQSQDIMKNAISGEIESVTEPLEVEMSQPQVKCKICSFEGNEQRFVNQAAREPRPATTTTSAY